MQKEKPNIRKILHFIFSVPRSIYFNLKYLPFNQAIKLPILISNRAYIKKATGEIEIVASNIKTGMIKMGFGEVGIFSPKKEVCVLELYGKITFQGKASIGVGSGISCRGHIIFGHNFVITAKTNIICFKEITFGDDCILSWNDLILDTDFHKVLDSNSRKILNPSKRVKFGSKVWLGANCTVLKGSEIGSNCVIASNSLINSKIEGNNLLIGGSPAKIIREGVDWEE